MTTTLEQRLQQIADENGYGLEIQHAMRLAAEAATKWYSPDVLPNVKRGDSGFFYVAVKRSHGGTYVFPAVFLNEMELAFEDGSEPESGNRCLFEASDESCLCSGWFDFKVHADYDDYYMPLLDESDELVAWSEAPVFSGKYEHWTTQPPKVKP